MSATPATPRTNLLARDIRGYREECADQRQHEGASMKPHTIRIELRDGSTITGHVITADAARVVAVFRHCEDVVAVDITPEDE